MHGQSSLQIMYSGRVLAMFVGKAVDFFVLSVRSAFIKKNSWVLSPFGYPWTLQLNLIRKNHGPTWNSSAY